MAEARALLVESFVGEVIDKLRSEPLRQALWRSAQPRLKALASSGVSKEER
jgi:hypothetical protein